MSSKQTEFKGSKVISLYKGDTDDKKDYIVGFGLRKAQAIIAHIKDIQDFVDANSGK